jgi:hypothetical protein
MDNILKASYGDLHQREQNQKLPDHKASLAIYEAAKCKKNLQPLSAEARQYIVHEGCYGSLYLVKLPGKPIQLLLAHQD